MTPHISFPYLFSFSLGYIRKQDPNNIRWMVFMVNICLVVKKRCRGKRCNAQKDKKERKKEQNNKRIGDSVVLAIVDSFYSLNSKGSFLVLHGLLHYEEKRVDDGSLSKRENTELRLFVILTKSFFCTIIHPSSRFFISRLFFSFQGNPHLLIVSASCPFVNALDIFRACIFYDVQETKEKR